jgi:hypothetical protein
VWLPFVSRQRIEEQRAFLSDGGALELTILREHHGGRWHEPRGVRREILRPVARSLLGPAHHVGRFRPAGR